VTVKVALVAFAATVTDGGTVAALLLLDRLTNAPPLGARPVRVTVAVALVLPPTSSTGDRAKDCTLAGLMARDAEAFEVPYDVVMLAFVGVDTTAVEMVKFADDFPEVMVTLAGTVAAELLDFVVMVIPPVGAGPVRLTVPVELLPPTTVVGFRLSDKS
jgi:hypothetical protein